MKLSHIGTISIFMMGALISFQNCAPPSARLSNSPPVQLQSLEKLEDELKSLADSDLTCMTNTDCKLVDVGVAPCGGADYQIVVSIRNPQYQSVLSLAEEYGYQDKIQTRPDIVGICSMRIPEVAKCVAHSCLKELENAF
jgi:hypothetical protein